MVKRKKNDAQLVFSISAGAAPPTSPRQRNRSLGGDEQMEWTESPISQYETGRRNSLHSSISDSILTMSSSQESSLFDSISSKSSVTSVSSTLLSPALPKSSALPYLILPERPEDEFDAECEELPYDPSPVLSRRASFTPTTAATPPPPSPSPTPQDQKFSAAWEQPSPGSQNRVLRLMKSTPYRTVRQSLDLLHGTADAFGPLKALTGGLLTIIDFLEVHLLVLVVMLLLTFSPDHSSESSRQGRSN
jgi:hypothetical protein